MDRGAYEYVEMDGMPESTLFWVGVQDVDRIAVRASDLVAVFAADDPMLFRKMIAEVQKSLNGFMEAALEQRIGPRIKGMSDARRVNEGTE